MKQSEKLDVILRYLYERRNNRVEYSIATILEESGIAVDYIELARLANQLRTDRLIELNVLSEKLKKARITSKGITYCEEGSYSNKGKGQTVVNNYHIIDSPQANIVVGSSQVTINQEQHDKAENIINEIRKTISHDQTVDLLMKKEILECLTEIESGIANKKAPKFAIKSLLGMGSDYCLNIRIGFKLGTTVPRPSDLELNQSHQRRWFIDNKHPQLARVCNA